MGRRGVSEVTRLERKVEGCGGEGEGRVRQTERVTYRDTGSWVPRACPYSGTCSRPLCPRTSRRSDTGRPHSRPRSPHSGHLHRSTHSAVTTRTVGTLILVCVNVTVNACVSQYTAAISLTPGARSPSTIT